jgi:predicted GNAT family acetyltransferase
VSWKLTESLDEYHGRAGEFVAARPAENTVLLTVAETVRKRGPHAYGDESPLFGWWEGGGAFLHTPPFPLTTTALPDPAIAALAAALADRSISAFAGPADVARTFADARGGSWSVRRREWLYRLGTLRRPDPPVPGRVVPAADVDRDLLVSWMGTFMAYIGEGDRDPRRQVENNIGGLSVWLHDDEPVCLAGTSPRLAGMVRIGPVYTPPELRGRGYGAALTAALCEAAADAEILLFADQANPTSNRLYQRLGFEPVQERLLIAF